MKTPIATMALAAALAAPATAQVSRNRTNPAALRPARPAAAGQLRPTTPRVFQPTPRNGAAAMPAAGARTTGAPSAPSPTATAGAAKADASVKQATTKPPVPIPLDQLKKPAIPLPNVPIEPYLLRKENGPFMVMVHTFRGPQASQYALALTLELRKQFKLPAYIFHLKIKPGGSNIRGVQPTATADIANAELDPPAQYRVYDEAAVLVGNCPTIDEAEDLLHRVKKLHPKTLDALPTIWGHRKGKGLKWAMVTQNPLIPAQALYPGGRAHGHGKVAGPSPIKPDGTFDPFVAATAFQQSKKPDPLVLRMNRGPHSLYKCPGPYTLPVAEFNGRTAANINDPKFSKSSFLRKSPLATAADDAERLASNLARCKTLPKNIRPYVYHDRYSSKVCLGSFQGPEDPQLVQLRQQIPLIVTEMLQKEYTQIPLAPARELMIVPKP